MVDVCVKKSELRRLETGVSDETFLPTHFIYSFGFLIIVYTQDFQYKIFPYNDKINNINVCPRNWVDLSCPLKWVMTETPSPKLYIFCQDAEIYQFYILKKLNRH